MKLLYVIPSYEPSEALLSVVSGLLAHNKLCLVVDDGSGQGYRRFFDQVEAQGAIVLRHGVNLGKGRALKTAINWALCQEDAFGGVVTLDSDGQHTMEDTLHCAQVFEQNPDAIIFGSRDFDAPQVPFKSRNGNKLTRTVLRYLCGIHLSDTQTGLRVLPWAFLPVLIHTRGERFEFETYMLLEANARDVPMVEVPIATVYENNNAGTHFNPLRDSLLVYAAFAKYLFTSLFSFVLDISLYALMVALLAPVTTHYILAATAVARVLSSLCNYAINRAWVFKKAGHTTLIKYYLLAACQLAVSGLATTWLHGRLPLLGAVGAKILVDALLFLCSFYVQRAFVFKNK